MQSPESYTSKVIQKIIVLLENTYDFYVGACYDDVSRWETEDLATPVRLLCLCPCIEYPKMNSTL